jgi:hypothetical protein
MSLAAGFTFLISENVKSPDLTESPEPDLLAFSLVKPLPMRLDGFVDRFLYQLSQSEELLIPAFSVLEPFFPYLSPNNLHKLVFTALVISYKAISDRPVKNADLEKIGLLKPKELFEFEKIVLQRIEWGLNYGNFENIREKLVEAGKKEEEKIKRERAGSEVCVLEDDETDYTEYERSESFSELSAFF